MISHSVCREYGHINFGNLRTEDDQMYCRNCGSVRRANAPFDDSCEASGHDYKREFEYDWDAVRNDTERKVPPWTHTGDLVCTACDQRITEETLNKYLID